MNFVLVLAEYNGSSLGELNDWVNPILFVGPRLRPISQEGRYNLPGGKIESGEEILDAAVREFKEETGIDGKSPELYGRIRCQPGIIHCVKVLVTEWKINPRPEETEKFSWIEWDNIKDDSRLMSNLRIIVPLMQLGIKDFVIDEESPSIMKDGKKVSTVTITTTVKI